MYRAEVSRAARKLRRTLELTQEELAALAGVSQQTISRFERGIMAVSPASQQAILDALRRADGESIAGVA